RAGRREGEGVPYVVPNEAGRNGVHFAGLTGEVTPGGLAELVRELKRIVETDDEPRALVLNIDSDGGDATLVPETARLLHGLRDVMTVVAVVNPRACSAAYWLASAAHVIVAASDRAEVGSVGARVNWTERHSVTAGRFKGNRDHEARNHKGRENALRSAETLRREFESEVARFRGVSRATVRSNYGEGKVFRAEEALARGMIDMVIPLAGVWSSLQLGVFEKRIDV